MIFNGFIRERKDEGGKDNASFRWLGNFDSELYPLFIAIISECFDKDLHQSFDLLMTVHLGLDDIN